MSDAIQQAEAEVKKVEGEVKAKVAVARAEFDALVARVEAVEHKLVGRILTLEGNIKAALTHMGQDAHKFFAKL
jgi:hypothetical protein